MSETVYEHIKGNDTFTVTAAERWSIGMIRRLKEKYPDQVDIRHTNSDGSMVVRLPFEWMRIVPKKRDTLTAEQRMVRSERMRDLKAQSARAAYRENDLISEDIAELVSEDIPAPYEGQREAGACQISTN